MGAYRKLKVMINLWGLEVSENVRRQLSEVAGDDGI